MSIFYFGSHRLVCERRQHDGLLHGVHHQLPQLLQDALQHGLLADLGKQSQAVGGWGEGERREGRCGDRGMKNRQQAEEGTLCFLAVWRERQKKNSRSIHPFHPSTLHLCVKHSCKLILLAVSFP